MKKPEKERLPGAAPSREATEKANQLGTEPRSRKHARLRTLGKQPQRTIGKGRRAKKRRKKKRTEEGGKRQCVRGFCYCFDGLIVVVVLSVFVGFVIDSLVLFLFCIGSGSELCC